MLAEAKRYVKSLAKVGYAQYYGIHFMNKILCPHCGKEVEISQALEHQIKDAVLAKITAQHKKELEETREKALEQSAKKLKEQFELQLKRLEEDKK